ncbi:hypothetical protein Bca101_045955 [Brassica carinata]
MFRLTFKISTIINFKTKLPTNPKIYQTMVFTKLLHAIICSELSSKLWVGDALFSQTPPISSTPTGDENVPRTTEFPGFSTQIALGDMSGSRI